LDCVPSFPLCGFFLFAFKKKENEETASIVLHAGKMLPAPAMAGAGVKHDAFSAVKQLIKKLHKKYYRS